METAKKIDHSKDEYYLSYALMDLKYGELINEKHCYVIHPKEECPLDNNRINNGYIECKSTGRGIPKSENMRFKCFSLHSIVDNEDIVDYSHGAVGYDLNPESMDVFAGGWQDLSTNNYANNLIDNKELLSKKKMGQTYVDESGKVHEIMNKKYQNRVKWLKEYINNDGERKKNISNDDSFRSDNYKTIEDNDGKICIVTTNEYNIQSQRWYQENNTQEDNESTLSHITMDLYDQEHINKNKPIITGRPFLLKYDKYKKTIHVPGNELLGKAKDPKKGIKVDRIFVLEKKMLALKEKQNGNDKRYKDIYDRYINKLTDVLIEQFPFGEIRVVQGSIEEGQTNVFLSPKKFIETYFVNEDDKNKYLKKLESKKEEVTKKQNFKENILNGFNVIKEKLGEGEAKNDPKSRNNKIFLNKKWYDRAHLTEKSIVRSDINKVFDSYVRGKINDEDAKRQLNNIVKSHRRFFNSTYC